MHSSLAAGRRSAKGQREPSQDSFLNSPPPIEPRESAQVIHQSSPAGGGHEYRISVDPQKDPEGVAKLEKVQKWLEAQRDQETGAKTSITREDNHLTIKNPGHVISHELKVAFDKQMDGLRQEMAGALAAGSTQAGQMNPQKPVVRTR